MKRLIIFFLLAFAGAAHAQINTDVLEYEHEQAVRYRQVEDYRRYHPWPPAGLRRAIDSLPFFDDFSRSHVMPDSTLWKVRSGVLVNNRLGFKAPSRKVASFDGISASGFAYSATPQAVGLADSLVSNDIDLSTVDTSNVRLSFYLQAGNAEVELRPDALDSMVVQFYRPAGYWQTVSVYNGGTNYDWRYREIRVPGRWMHPAFKFRFLSYGRQNGLFDVWNLTYVYLDANRLQGDSVEPDLAYSGQPEALFQNYRSVPYKHAFHNAVKSDSINGYFKNHNNDLIVFNAEFFLEKKAVSTGGAYVPLIPPVQNGANTIEGSILIAQPREFRRLRVFANQLPETRLPVEEPPSKATLRYGYNFIRDNNFNQRIHNDTTEAFAELSDYYAYDDGTAEKSFVLFGNGARMLYRYIIPTLDTLVGITFGFDEKSFQFNASAIPLGIVIYKKLPGIDSTAENRIYFESQVLIRSNERGANYYFPLNRQIPIEGTFYIGFQQSNGVENSLYVKADINSNANNALYSSIQAGRWDAYTRSRNALMIRPHFVCRDCQLSVRKPRPTLALVAMPNPAHHTATLKGDKLTEARLVSLSGKVLLRQTLNPTEGRHTLSLQGLPPGFYLLEASDRDGNFGVVKLVVE